MRERLIELLKSNLRDFQNDVAYWHNEHIGELADALLANGVIVPPCKVGDTVYEFFDVRGFYNISELIVENVLIGINPPKCQVYCRSKTSNSKSVFCEDSFGNTFFFTKEDAERAEKERLRDG